MRRGDDEVHDNPVTNFVASVIAHAGVAEDPKWDRLALLAHDGLAKAKHVANNDDLSVARLHGWTGSAGKLQRPTGIVADVLARAQQSLDSEEPDLAFAAAGIAAARRLINATVGRASDDALLFMAGVLLAGDGLAPDRLTAGYEPPDDLQPDDDGEAGDG